MRARAQKTGWRASLCGPSVHTAFITNVRRACARLPASRPLRRRMCVFTFKQYKWACCAKNMQRIASVYTQKPSETHAHMFRLGHWCGVVIDVAWRSHVLPSTTTINTTTTTTTPYSHCKISKFSAKSAATCRCSWWWSRADGFFGGTRRISFALKWRDQ